MGFDSKLSRGQIIGERYRIAGHIGSGGMSHVYLAEDLRLPGKYWAVKESLSAGEAEGMLQAEAELLTGLQHPRIPRTVDYYPPDHEGYCYLIMDYIEGITLNQFMKEYAGPLPAPLVLLLAGHLLEVLQYLHRQHPPIVYCDLKPSNIILDGNQELVLIDFGIARSLRTGIGEKDTVKLGTVGFAAPEQYGGGENRPAADLYGLGALMLYMATGGMCSRWETGMEARLQGRIPDGLIPVIRRLLRYRPEERYQEASEVLQALERIVQELPASGKPVHGRNKSSCTSVIALLGVSPGLGTTHTSLAVCRYLSRCGATAWVDYAPDSPVYSRLDNLMGGKAISRHGRDGQAAVTWEGADYWKRPQNGELAELLEGTYRYVVLDLGSGGYEGALEAFIHCDTPVLIASGADWRLEEVLVWLRRQAIQPQRHWRVGLPLSSPSAAMLLQEVLGVGQVFELPLQRDPFTYKGKLTEALQALLKDTTGGKVPGRPARFFRK
ncbi:serine/threonine protein kinase [Paenibacillus albidus]|uniref:serine/threonine protein kinase n=1 Tax=Paenibacillus albidus TaxID=2041023 RepID=UPI001BEB4297|nr:serine/threonine-protein kinase [Paenibacillus albidus]MBT2287932.1 serine/threonine protein kinase [Paenibacillus albidus]